MTEQQLRQFAELLSESDYADKDDILIEKNHIYIPAVEMIKDSEGNIKLI